MSGMVTIVAYRVAGKTRTAVLQLAAGEHIENVGADDIVRTLAKGHAVAESSVELLGRWAKAR